MEADALLQGDIKGAATLMGLLSSETRLRILCRLLEREQSVGELARLCDIPQPTMSQQLKRLKEAGLVEARREAQTIYYRLAGEEVIAILETLHRLYCAR
ncbi:ArsR/SmtB family transcription factor [Pseudoroseicyclus tamaricis]|uniref:Winged helix-turn-helix transcriptional regulator n=1 Tax=Pseudoroseicyclus tamaricis TaxID=2705421 RepID=A0A6B2K0L6_9RHOB|nr:metalloregulator ArsR/SmtB family transcription factor [Pseudoroseicyclus tamaricis]NDU99855.1 winged helix-turn-helix transcriptional regulator [Pseudoroseicyclus tamaricis]